MKFVSLIMFVAIALGSMATAPSIFAQARIGMPSKAAAAKSGLSIINDDLERALAEANKRKLPLFVEVWAPW